LINLKLNLAGLGFEAQRKKTNILRVLFDDYIYKHVTRGEFEASGRSNNMMVQIADHGLDYITVRIKTEGATEAIGIKDESKHKLTQYGLHGSNENDGRQSI
jgi:hypothetical protein